MGDVEGGAAGHGQYGAGAGVHDDDGAAAGLVILDRGVQLPFGQLLHVAVNGKDDVGARLGRHLLLPGDRDRVAPAIALVDQSAGGAAQLAVVVRLQAGQTDVIPPGEAQQGRRHIPLGVDAAAGAHEADAGQAQVLYGDAGLVVQVAGHRHLAADGGVQVGEDVVSGTVEDVCQLLGGATGAVPVAPDVFVYQHVVGVDAGCQGVAVAVEDGAAAGHDIEAADVLLLSRQEVMLVVAQLEVGQATDEAEGGHQEHGHHDGQASGDAVPHFGHRPPSFRGERPPLGLTLRPLARPPPAGAWIREGEACARGIPTTTPPGAVAPSWQGGSARARVGPRALARPR